MSSELIPVHELLSNGDLLLVQDGNHGGNYPKVDEFVNVGIPLITGACLDRGTIDYSQASYLTRERADMLRVGRALAGDVLLTHKGTMGKTAIVPESEYPFTVLNPQLTLYRVAPKGKLDGRYLKYYFDSAHFQELLTRISSTSTISTLSIREQKQLTIPVPKIATQKSVVEILGSLDDRITLLRETNTTLEAIAQALFKSWFVDFDPVHAKMQGRAPEGMDEATAALFPDSFEESELGDVPKGWRFSTLGKSFELTMGQSPPGDTYNQSEDGLPFYQGRTDFGFRFPTKRIYCNAPTRLAEIGDALVSVRAPVGDVNMAIERCCIGRGVASVRHQSGCVGYTLYAMKNLGAHFKNFDTEGTIFGSINKKDFEALPVVVPSQGVLVAFDEISKALDGSIEINEQKIRGLVEIRDTLLPRLISGQLQLPEVGQLEEFLV